MKKKYFLQILILTCIVIFNGCSDETVVSNKNCTKPTKNVAIKNNPVNYNIFLDNAVSMQGFLNNSFTYKTNLYEFLVSLKNASTLSKGINLNYFNNKISNFIQLADLSSIDNFINRNYIITYPNTNKNIVEPIINAISYDLKNNVYIIISDFKYLNQANNVLQDGQIEQELARFKTSLLGTLETKTSSITDFATLIYQFNSNFIGTYTKANKQNININSQRMYYMLIIGTKPNLYNFTKSTNVRIPKLNALYLSKNSNNATIFNDFKIFNNPIAGQGTYKPTNLNCNIIQNAKKGNNGIFSFYVDVNFGDELVGESFFYNPKNYSVSANWKIDKIEKSLVGHYTHRLKLSTQKLANEDLIIEVKNNKPDWVKNYNLDNDNKIEFNIHDQSKTLGLQALVDAFYETIYQNQAIENNITIQKILIKIKKEN